MDETDREWLDRYVIESYFLPLEAGGAAHDIDGDGDLTSFSVATAKATRAKTLFIADTPVSARDMLHGHTLDLGDVDGDGTSTSSPAEMAKWKNKWCRSSRRHSHEGRLADLDVTAASTS